MATYLIGDVQGCLDSLQALLTKINFNPENDRLGFVGDLVNRGPKSLETLDFILSLKNPLVVLGNHDLHFLALYFLGASHFHSISHTLDNVLNSPLCKKYIDFLLQQPFLICEDRFAMVHAGIPPQWTIETAQKYSNEISMLLQKNPIAFFKNIYGNDPTTWNENLTDWDRARYIVNAFTRIRFCDAKGVLDLENKTDVSADLNFKPWFSWRSIAENKLPIYFGHWASLEGRCNHPTIFALDTGCAWNGKLTAVRLEDQKLFFVMAQEK